MTPAMYRQLHLRYGMRWLTGGGLRVYGRTLAYTLLLCLSLASSAYSHVTTEGAIHIEVENRRLRNLVSIREEQITRCLNGEHVGTFYDKRSHKDVAVVCRPAEEIEI